MTQTNQCASFVRDLSVPLPRKLAEVARAAISIANMFLYNGHPRLGMLGNVRVQVVAYRRGRLRNAHS